MKRYRLLFLLLAFLSVVSGYLMSKSSWIGKVGMTFIHKGYNFTKVWWQGACAVFIIFILLYLLHTFLQKKFTVTTARVVHTVIVLAAVTGLYFTYVDFSEDFSHRLLGWRFHYGFYLIWVGWITIGLFFLFKRSTLNTAINSDKKEQAIQ